MNDIELSGGEVLFIDDEDRGLIATNSWYQDERTQDIFASVVLSKCPCCGAATTTHKSLGRILLGLSTGDERIVIHINRNKLDFRRKNLQAVTRQQELFRHDVQLNNTSGYKGVYWYGRYKKWRANIGFNEKRIHIGYFNSLREAAIAYNKRAIELFGEFAWLNPIEDERT